MPAATVKDLVADFRALLPARCATQRLSVTPWGGPLISHRVQPEYPAGAKQEGLSGKVPVRLLIDENGDVAEALARDGSKVLCAAAEVAALQWKFASTPGGRATPCFDETLTFDFVLDGPNATIAVTEPFAVRWNDWVLRLQVPSGFRIESKNYKEGILTTLSYSDGSRLLLDPGGMYPISMLFHDPAYESASSVNLGPKVTRSGRITGTRLYWREDSYRMKDTIGRDLSPMGRSSDFGYDKVSPARRAAFDEVLDSLVWEANPMPTDGR